MDYKNAIIISLNEDRKKHSFEKHWGMKILRPTEIKENIEEKIKIIPVKCSTCQEIIQSTHLDEKTVVTTLNELEAEGKIRSIFKGGKNCSVLWWALV